MPTTTTTTPAAVDTVDPIALTVAAKTALTDAVAHGDAARKGFVAAAVAIHTALAAGVSVRDLVVNGTKMGNKDSISRWGIVGMMLAKDTLYADQYDGAGSPAEVLFSLVRKGVQAGVGLAQQREVIAATADSVAAEKALSKAIDKAIAAAKKPATPPAPPAPSADQQEGEGEGEPVQPVPASDSIATLLTAASGPITKAVALSQVTAATADEVQVAKALIAALSAIANGKTVKAAA